MEKIIFEDFPSTKTPLNAENLNKIQTNAENAINEVDDKFNYSTEEKIIGTWEGNPLYRKVISTRTPTTASTWEIIAEIPNNIKLKNSNAIIAGYLPAPVYIASNYYAVYQITSGYIQMNVAGYTNNSVEFIIEYTKTNG